MKKGAYRLGKNIPQWSESAQVISFIVTEDCNLRCKYCYITHKASNKVMNFETAKCFIDYIFTSKIHKQKSVAVEFIGGEPCLEMELIDQICDYFKLKAYEVQSDWYWNYRISICSNGVNYSSDEVQHFIAKNLGKLSFAISIDGTKEKHDSQRIFPNGDGSYDIIEKSIPLYISQFGGHTKATFSRNDLPTLKDSIISLWNKGITEVAANVVFEDVWEAGDDVVFEEQLKELADYALDNHLFDKYICTFFLDFIGQYYNREDLERSWCGAGKMLALGPNGNIYPCVRYKDYSLNKNPERIFGNIYQGGIDMELVRPFIQSKIRLQSDSECINCSVATGCAFCQGFNYDVADEPTIFYRAKYICKMHKARVRANNYYFAKLFNRFGIEKDNFLNENNQLYFLLDDDYVTYCQHENLRVGSNHLDKTAILRGLQYCHQNFFSPVFVHSKTHYSFEPCEKYESYHIKHIVPAKFYKEAANLKDCIFAFEPEDMVLPISGLDFCQLNIRANDIQYVFNCVKSLLEKSMSINLNIYNLTKDFDEKEYEIQMNKIAEYLYQLNKVQPNKPHMISQISDVLTEAIKKHPTQKGCKAGSHSFVYAPDKKLYACAAHYGNSFVQETGTLEEGLKTKFLNLYKCEDMPLCEVCDAYHCQKCIALNEAYTKERNVSPAFQCRKSMIEKNAAIYYSSLIGIETNLVAVKDPIEFLLANGDTNVGIYTY